MSLKERKQLADIIRRVDTRGLEAQLATRFNFTNGSRPPTELVARGIYPGAASGEFHTDRQAAMCAKREGRNVIYYVSNLNLITAIDFRDIRGFDGLAFSLGSQTNHFAIILRRLGVPMIQIPVPATAPSDVAPVGKGGLEYKIGSFSLCEGEHVSFDGSNGRIYRGLQTPTSPALSPEMIKCTVLPPRRELRDYVALVQEAGNILKEHRKQIWVNADTVSEIEEARRWGAESVSLVRSENAIRRTKENANIYGVLTYLLMEGKGSRDRTLKSVLGQFEDMQYKEFRAVLTFQDGRRTQIRLLDPPPLYELFSMEQLPEIVKGCSEPSEAAHVLQEAITHRHVVRGAQILQEWPAIYEAQLRALCRAYADARETTSRDPDLKVFIPYVIGMEPVLQTQRLKQNVLESSAFKTRDIDFDLGITLETATGCAAASSFFRDAGIKYFALGTNDLIPVLAGRPGERGITPHYTREAEDGTPLLADGVVNFVRTSLDGIAAAAKRGHYEIGLCGEVNQVLLHPENLGGELLKRCSYVAAGRPRQVPVLMVMLAQALLNADTYKK